MGSIAALDRGIGVLSVIVHITLRRNVHGEMCPKVNGFGAPRGRKGSSASLFYRVHGDTSFGAEGGSVSEWRGKWILLAAPFDHHGHWRAVRSRGIGHLRGLGAGSTAK